MLRNTSFLIILFLFFFFSFISASEKEAKIKKAKEIKKLFDACSKVSVNQNRFDHANCFGTVVDAIDSNNLEWVKVFFDPKYKLDFNAHFEHDGYTLIDYYKDINVFGRQTAIIHNYTPLLFAIGQERYEIVEAMVKATTLKPKLNLMKSHRNHLHVSPRQLARMMNVHAVRKKLLDLLKVDPNIHDMTDFNRILKNDLTVTVREAVMSQNVKMVEAALTLGNFGDKSDPEIIKYAIKKGNFMILEMLVMEDYAIPAPESIPKIPRSMAGKANLVNKLLMHRDFDKRVPSGEWFDNWQTS